jgi:hypothetical protein
MKIDIQHQPVKLAMIRLREHTPEYNPREVNKLFESKYHCKIHIDPSNPWACSGSILFDEEKYYNWFLMQFEGDSLAT